MIAHGQSFADPATSFLPRRFPPPRSRFARRFSPVRFPSLRPAAALRHDASGDDGDRQTAVTAKRREFLLFPSLAMAAGFLYSFSSAAAEEKEKAAEPLPATPASSVVDEVKVNEKENKQEPEILSRIYDATVIGEPEAVGKDKRRLWEKLMGARVVYLGESEMVPDRDDRVLELEIIKNLRNRCSEQQRTISLALEAFPIDLQQQLNQFMDGRIDGGSLKTYTSHWPSERWQEYEPLLNYCRDNGVRVVACGTPLKVLRTVQAEGIRGLSNGERKLYAPPAGSGFISGFTSITGRSLIDSISSSPSSLFGPSSYLSAQARVVDDYTMSQSIIKAVTDAGSAGMLVVIAGASHVIYGSRGIGIPARISKKLQKKNQAVILLDPERQQIRREGEVPVADFLWYSAAKPCSRNCFDRVEIARVMNAAGRRREALPQDLQKGLDLGIVSPEILQNFFDLEQYPLISELIHRFQGFRERLLADPKFLHRLAIEEAISITTTLLAQYERRKGRFLEEIDYVLTDTIRGSVVDFFTVWLPAPTLSFLTHADESSSSENFNFLKDLIGSVPDNAFQKNVVGKDWNLSHRFVSVFFGGLKLAGVGFISSIGAGVASDILYLLRQSLRPALSVNKRKRSPIYKSAIIYGCFLGTSANLRYQIIAGIVEHRLSDYLLSYGNGTLLVNALSFTVRTINSYWGTQQWVDLARYTGLQIQKKEAIKDQVANTSDVPLLECSATQINNMDESNNQVQLLECSTTKINNMDENNNQSGDTPT